jgi:hypothetical protein
MLLEDGLTVMSGGQLFTGIFFVFYAIFTFSITPITPKVAISPQAISYRRSPFGQTQTLNWSDITSIEFSAYLITFHLEGRSHSFDYKANSATSIEIKTSIREVAEQLNIEVTGG